VNFHALDTNIRLGQKWLKLTKPECYIFNYVRKKVLSHRSTGFSELSRCKMVHVELDSWRVKIDRSITAYLERVPRFSLKRHLADRHFLDLTVPWFAQQCSLRLVDSQLVDTFFQSTKCLSDKWFFEQKTRNSGK
jgi:hypothetical protein